MAKHSITAVFDTRADADKAVAQLTSSGVPMGDITLLPPSGSTSTSATDAAEGTGKGFWGSLEQLFGGTEDHATYAESLRRGGTMVSVRVEDDEMDRVVDILEQHGSVDLDEREMSWRSEGWTGDAAGLTAGAGTLGAGAIGAGALGTAGFTGTRDTTPSPAAPVAALSTAVVDRAAVTDRTAMTTSDAALGAVTGAVGDVLQVVEERLDIGKRSVSRGKVRVHSYVVERQVSEDITLHAETVSVERRTVDIPVSATAFAVDPFKERTIEMEEFGEEAVVAKSAHVVEEIGIRKDATDRVETVRDTLRSTKVDIEDGRAATAVSGLTGAHAADIADDMEVVGSDGAHVGTVDHTQGGRIKLKKVDPAAGGEHHFLSTDLVTSVADKVMLSVTAAEARTRWTSAG